MTDQDSLQDETLFDGMAEQSEAGFINLLITDLFMDNGTGVIFKEFAAVIADVFENSNATAYEQIGVELAPAMRSYIHRTFEEMELGDDMLLTKSSDKAILTEVSRALRAIGDAIA
jgi:hypothetical protein